MKNLERNIINNNYINEESSNNLERLVEASNSNENIEFYEDVDNNDSETINKNLSEEDLKKVYSIFKKMTEKIDNLTHELPTFEKKKETKNDYKINWLIDSFSLEEVECGVNSNLYTKAYIEITPIMFLSKVGKTRSLYKQIRKNPWEVNLATINGKTALMLAATYGNQNCLKLLMCAGADIDHQDSHGATALMFACNYAQHEIVKSLIEKGANALLKDKNGVTAMDLARENKDIVLIEILSQA